MINSGFSGPFAVFGSIGSSLTSGDFLAIDVSKDTPSTCLSLRLCMPLSAAAAARSFSRCSRCSMRLRFLTSACSLCLFASSFALAYALSLPAFTPFNADFPVMITRHMFRLHRLPALIQMPVPFRSFRQVRPRAAAKFQQGTAKALQLLSSCKHTGCLY